MRHLSPVYYSDLRSQYDLLIGWGPGEVEFTRRFNYNLFKIDYLIDGLGERTYKYLCNMEVMKPEILKDFIGKKICFIIFPNIEERIIEQIKEYLHEFDTIIYRLIKSPALVSTYSRSYEDLLLMDLIKIICPRNITYLDIGVCHPIVRNNTYGLYEQGNYDGLLVEPNPAMCTLIEQYRPNNKLLKCGVCSGENQTLPYYEYENTPGINSFNKVREASENSVFNLPLININKVMGENFENPPTILDIDAEGMDMELLTVLDTEQYKIPIICAEALASKEQMRAMMQQKGYVHYTSTFENDIYIRKGII